MEQMETKEPAVRPRFGGRRYGLVSGTWIVFQDAPLAAVTRAAVTLAAGAATGPLLVLATERFVATALDVAGGSLPPGAIAAPVIALGALFAMQIVESVVRALADARIEAGLRRGFRADLTRKRARLDYHHVERSSTWDLLRRVTAGPEAQARPAPENGPVKQAFDDGVGLAALAVRVIGLAAVLARLGWWIVPAAVAITVPFVLLGIGSGRRHYELERKLSGRRRRAEYLSEEVLQGREAAQERALFDFGDYVNTRWRDVYEQARRLTSTGSSAFGSATRAAQSRRSPWSSLPCWRCFGPCRRVRSTSPSTSRPSWRSCRPNASSLRSWCRSPPGFPSIGSSSST